MQTFYSIKKSILIICIVLNINYKGVNLCLKKRSSFFALLLSSPTTLSNDVKKRLFVQIALPLISTVQHHVCSHKIRSSVSNYIRQLDVTPSLIDAGKYKVKEGQREKGTTHFPSAPPVFLPGALPFPIIG